MRADMEALTARLIQRERALIGTRQQVAAVPKVTATTRRHSNDWQSSNIHW